MSPAVITNLKPNNMENKITSQEFVKKWLPNWEEKLNEWYDTIVLAEPFFTIEFADKYFPEALEAFAKAQREEIYYLLELGCINNSFSDEVALKSAILNAPTP